MTHDGVFSNVGGDFFRFLQRSDPIIIIIEQFRGWVLFLLQEHQLRVEEESAFFRKVSRRLSGSCEGDDSVQMFLSFACRARTTHGRQFDVRQRSDTCSGSALLPRRAPCFFFVPSTAPGNSSRLGALRTGGMTSNARAPWDESCSPVPATISRCSTDESFQSFDDGSSNCQGAKARFPRCSSVCGCITRILGRSGPECCCSNI